MSQAPAVREMPDQGGAIMSSESALTNDQIRYIANTDIVPRHLRGKPDAMVAVILKGRALGLDDIHSLSAINFIEGKPTLSAETMVTLARRRGHSISWEAKPGESCTVKGKRRDTGDEGSVTWTMDMAKKAGLSGKDNWQRYPDTMLYWRAVSQMCRMLFPDVLMGVSYTEDEAQEAAERGHVTQAIENLPAVEEQKIRTEPLSGPSEAQLNRIAALEQRFEQQAAYQTVLRGVFGVEMATELSQTAATQYEAMLESALLSTGSAEGPSGEEPAASGEGTPASDTEAGAAEEATTDGAQASFSSADDLPDEPAPDDEVVEGEVEEVDERLVELAGDTEIPIGTYKGQKLKDIHDGWIEYGLRNTGRLPAPFVEALELWARERTPEIWSKVRG